eukprot:scaffold297844_cov33-Tisochrysis_lutea.AAC.1
MSIKIGQHYAANEAVSSKWEAKDMRCDAGFDVGSWTSNECIGQGALPKRMPKESANHSSS